MVGIKSLTMDDFLKNPFVPLFLAASLYSGESKIVRTIILSSGISCFN